MANSEPFPNGWGPRQYILAAIAGTLAGSVLIVVTAVILSPARVAFSVSGAPTAISVNDRWVVVNFTLVADNPSRRAGVRYSAVVVNLRLYSTDKRKAESVRATVRDAMPLHQPPVSSRDIAVSAFFFNSFLTQNFGGANCTRAAPPVSVVVIAQVRFKVWLAYSRTYGIVVTCSPVNLIAPTNASATRVNCVA